VSDAPGERGAGPGSAVLLAVGTELTEGAVLNTHFRFLGSSLASQGYRIRWGVQLPDDGPLFASKLREALDGAELVITTGGLGPTSDDLTRETVAAVAGLELEFHEEIWEELQARWAATGRPIAHTNRKQALIPRGFTVLANPNGTAPGFCGWVGRTLLAALPGPPRELEPMFLEQLNPLLPRVAGAEGEVVATALLVPESQLEEALQRSRRALVGGSLQGAEQLQWGTRFAEDRIVLTLRGGTAEGRERLLASLREELGEPRIRLGDCRPNLLLYELLRSRGETLALAESCTGGLIGKWLTDLPGSSSVFWGGFTVYSNAAKQRLLGVPGRLLRRHGAVSPEAARAMARQLLRKTPAAVGLVVTGIAGPDGGSAEKPVGTVWIAAGARGAGEVCRGFHFAGGRDAIRRRAAVTAMLLAEWLLRGSDNAALEALGSAFQTPATRGGNLT
jgi:nicotinamide-nucleotide amidase